jgi:hypothetical protein
MEMAIGMLVGMIVGSALIAFGLYVGRGLKK